MAIAIGTPPARSRWPSWSCLTSAAKAKAITELTDGLPNADGQQSARRDGHHQARSATVEHAEHWPGFHTAAEFFSGQELVVERPAHFFRNEGRTPKHVVLCLSWPEILGPIAEARKKVRQRIGDLEAQARQQRMSERRTVLGRAGVRRQDYREQPRTVEPRRKLRPTLAASNRWVRVEALQRNRAFKEAYCAARLQWLAIGTAVFPPGTYWMRCKPGVVVLE